jgi:hypothetical protein
MPNYSVPEKALNARRHLPDRPAVKADHVLPRARSKVATVMREFKHGTLHSGSGHLVKDRDQAIAIALSEAGLSKRSKKV